MAGDLRPPHHDLDDFTTAEHRLLADGDEVTVHLTIRVRHVASTMPLLIGVPVTGAAVEWTFMHPSGSRTAGSPSAGRVGTTWACSASSGPGRRPERRSRGHVLSPAHHGGPGSACVPSPPRWGRR
jgi:hypothetical protein